MDIEILINFGIIIIGIFNIFKLNPKKIFEINVVPISKPFYLLVLPLSSLFLVPNGIFVIIITCLIFTLIEKYNLTKYEKFTLIKIWNIVKLFTVVWLLLFVVSFVSQGILGKLPEQKIVIDLRQNGINAHLFELIFWSVIISPIIEEIFFRKLIYSTLKFYFAPLISTLISSTLFSLVHNNLSSFPLLLVLGIILCLSFEKTNSIIYPIIIHSMFNIIMLIFILLN